MGFGSDFQGLESHDALVQIQETEIRLLENMKACLAKRIEADRKYVANLTSIAQLGNKIEETEYHGYCSVFKAWAAVTKGTEQFVELLQGSLECLSGKLLEKINSLINEKKSSKKLYEEERNRMEKEFTRLKDEVQKNKQEYSKCMDKMQLEKIKYETLTAKGKATKGNKLDSSKQSYVNLSVKLHKAHNRYIMSLCEVTSFQDNYHNTTLPYFLDHHQASQEIIVQQCKDFLTEFQTQTTFGSAKHLAVYEPVEHAVNDINPDKEYTETFLEKHKSEPFKPIVFEYDSKVLDSYHGTLQANKIALDDFTHEMLVHSKASLTDEIEAMKRSVEKMEREKTQSSERVAELRRQLSSLSDEEYSEYLEKRKKFEELKKYIAEVGSNIRTKSDVMKLLDDQLTSLGENNPPAAMDLDIQNDCLSTNSTESDRPNSRLSRLKLMGINPFKKMRGKENGRREEAESYEDQESMDDGLHETDPNPGSTVKKLEDEDWFHGVLPREEVQRLLVNDGDFLVRESKNKRTNETQYVLSAYWQGYRHFIIQFHEGGWRFEGSMFPTIPELVNHQYKSGIAVTNKSGTVLKTPVVRESWELRNDDIALETKIGNGNFGEVFRGLFKKTSEVVAVKTCRDTLSEDQRKKFLMEGRILKQYDHPNIVKFIGIAAQRQPVMIIMEYVAETNGIFAQDFWNTCSTIGSKKSRLEELRYVWAKFPGLPYWPVQVVDKEEDKYIVYVKSDHAHLKVKCKDTLPFLKHKIIKKDEGIAALKKKRRYLEAFGEDLSWIISAIETEGESGVEKTGEPMVSNKPLSDDPGKPTLLDDPLISNKPLSDDPGTPTLSNSNEEYEGESGVEKTDETMVSNKPLSDDPGTPTPSNSNEEYEGESGVEKTDEPMVSNKPLSDYPGKPTLLDDPLISNKPLSDDPGTPTLSNSNEEYEGESEVEKTDETMVSNKPLSDDPGKPTLLDDPLISNKPLFDDPGTLTPSNSNEEYEGESGVEKTDEPMVSNKPMSDDLGKPTLLDDPLISNKPLSDDPETPTPSNSNEEYEGESGVEKTDETMVSNKPLSDDPGTPTPSNSNEEYEGESGVEKTDETMVSNKPLSDDPGTPTPLNSNEEYEGESGVEKTDETMVSNKPLSDDPGKPTLLDDPLISNKPLSDDPGTPTPSNSNEEYEGESGVEKMDEPMVSNKPLSDDPGKPTLLDDLLISNKPLSDDPGTPTPSNSNEEYVYNSEDEMSDIIMPMYTAVKLSQVYLSNEDMHYESEHEEIDDYEGDPNYEIEEDEDEEEEEQSFEEIVNTVDMLVSSSNDLEKPYDRNLNEDEMEDEETESQEEDTVNMRVTSSSTSDLEKPYQRNLNDQHKLHDKCVDKIYVKMYRASDIGQKGEKKDNRPYDTVHACKFCFKLFTHIQDHLQNKHLDTQEVKKLLKMKSQLKYVSEKEKLKEQIKKGQDFLRQEGDHIHNRKVCFHREGELLVQRKGSAKDSFDHTLYGPCPDCLMWVMRDKSLQSHQRKCAFATAGKFGHEKKSLRVTISKALSGQVVVGREKSLVKKNVLTIMRRDRIFDIVQNDILLLELGEIWMIKSYDNKLKRCKTASFRMRLGARLLDAVRRKTGNLELDMLNLISPVFFEDVVNATLTLCQGDDDFQLKTPSVGLKVGYDLGRLAGLKICHCIKTGDTGGEDDAKKFVELMKINWSVRISKFAHIAVKEKHYNQHRKLPHPEDIKGVAETLVKLAGKLDLSTPSNYDNAVKVILPRLMVYNRRRSGEIEALSIDSYLKRTKEVDDVEEALLGKLSSLEEYLLKSQQLMWIRGKQGKRVPVLIPPDAHKGLEYICNEEVRRHAGIKENSPYLFANKGHGVYSALQCLKDCCQEASLTLLHPERLTSTGYRAYMATIAQCVGLQNHEVQWLCNHLGHTEEIHKTHYRHTLEGIERIQLGKLILLQDKNLLNQCRGKSLDEIKFDDIVDKIDGVPQGTDSDLELDVTRRPIQGSRQKWTEKEESELKILFSENLSKLKCPNTSELKAAICKSKQTEGCIHLRKPDTIKKKMSNMILKLRKN